MSPISQPCVRHRRVAARRRPYPFLSAASCHAPLEARAQSSTVTLCASCRSATPGCLSRRNKKIRPERMVRGVRATHPRAPENTGEHTGTLTASRNASAAHPSQGAVPLRGDGAPRRGASARGAPVAAARDGRAAARRPPTTFFRRLSQIRNGRPDGTFAAANPLWRRNGRRRGRPLTIVFVLTRCLESRGALIVL